ncbi:MAG: hypothetical protein ABIN89_26455 [Chitinophagaceae bacterium]
MKYTNKLFFAFLTIALLTVSSRAKSQSKPAASIYTIYSGNTHAHTSYTGSHGEQFEKSACKGIAVFGGDASPDSVDTWKAGYVKTEGCASIIIIRSTQYPGPNEVLKPDWQKFQGTPSAHFALAKANHYDFYVTTDHSQDYTLNPPNISNKAWVDSRQAADAVTNSSFVAIRGYEHSENNGPNGQGHINIINSAEYLNALDPKIDLPYLYNWLKTAKPNGDGPVVGTFNHPGPDQYNNWSYRDAAVTDIMTMLEVINSNNKIHYEGFLSALDKGWKVSPVCGNDNHGLTGIKKHTSRTFVLAINKTKAAILDAMKNRRTYASLDQNIQCSYTVNDKIMGSTLPGSKEYKFKISISDPDSGNPKDKITKIDIVSDSGKVVQTYKADAYSVQWSPTIRDQSNKYFFVRVYNAGGGDASGGDAEKPIAWLAPVWMGKQPGHVTLLQ